MTFNRSNLYTLLSVACIVGYIWLFYNISNDQLVENKSITVCFFKHITNISCPSCGTTRSVLTLIQGNLLESMYINPLGFLVGLIMLIVPIWIIFDYSTNKNTLFHFYNQIEVYLKNRLISFPLLIIVILNWIWNITKGV